MAFWLSFLYRKPSLEYQRGLEQIQRERKKTGLRDLTRLIREDAIDLSTLLYRDLITKPLVQTIA